MSKEIKQQPPAGEFTKECRKHICVSQIEGFVPYCVAKRLVYLLCDHLDTSEAENRKYSKEITEARQGAFGFRIKNEETLWDGMSRNYAEFDDCRTELNAKLDTSEQQRKDLLEALEKYGRHGVVGGDICEKSKHSDYNCTCGFEAVIAKAKQ